MNSKVLILLVVVLAATFITESEGFTAGAGNIGRRGLTRVRFEGLCSALATYCTELPVQRRFTAESTKDHE
ncbi:hypothetical protein AC249_AIPGENE19072 [Exaiptasia diaphana]|nr:hypothetical protein AC249_AIPGENE19072 [Exaiptasia diaphana]